MDLTKLQIPSNKTKTRKEFQSQALYEQIEQKLTHFYNVGNLQRM